VWRRTQSDDAGRQRTKGRSASHLVGTGIAACRRVPIRPKRNASTGDAMVPRRPWRAVAVRHGCRPVLPPKGNAGFAEKFSSGSAWNLDRHDRISPAGDTPVLRCRTRVGRGPPDRSTGERTAGGFPGGIADVHATDSNRAIGPLFAQCRTASAVVFRTVSRAKWTPDVEGQDDALAWTPKIDQDPTPSRACPPAQPALRNSLGLRPEDLWKARVK